MESYETLNEAVDDLLEKGYTTGLNLTSKSNAISNFEGSIRLNPKDFIIDEVHFFDETGEPGETVILIATSSKKYDTKILLMNAFVSYTVTNWTGLFQHFKDFLDNLFRI